ncbi:hypothetical protein FHR23_001585 [Stakelama sediminis]|uniref:Circumsporozoite protein n=1 Tax=Stakelama sediminis TaxID=463200 RepID=A0A840YYS1_9SPHN|nr:hypothetical protein [Stakelama sediminis]MBB5718662.1 hypothetical protein [Stakelama sediminis]
MKKIVFVAAAAGLMSLAACNSHTDTTNNTAAMMADNLEATADNLDAMADNTSNMSDQMMLENQADNAEMAADNIEDNM